MSENGPYPPPGEQPPQEPPPGGWTPHGPPPPGGPPPWTPAPPPPGGQRPAGQPGAAHKPGAVPLRPLGLGDMFDAAFRILRFNPKATVGAAVLVAAVTQAVPVAVTTALTGLSGSAVPDSSGGSISSEQLIGYVGSLASLGGGALLLQVGLILLTGVIAHVTHAAAVGRKLDLAEAWACTRGKRWRLFGLVLLVGLVYLLGFSLWGGTIVALALAGTGTLAVVLYGVLTGLFLILPLTIFFNVRVSYLAAVALMLEDVGVLGSLGRAFRLSSGQFWRIFGIGLLTGLVTSAAAFVLALPFGLGGNVAALMVPQYALLLGVVTQAVSTILTTAFTAPFTSAVTTLQYLDQRMRKEAYDVELMAQAGITGA